MKKIYIIFILFLASFTFSHLNAETYKLYTNSAAYKFYTDGSWTDWSDWHPSKMLVVISLDRGVINIYTDDIQEYDIIKYQGKENDNDGGESLKYLCVNEDGLRCTLRFRRQSDGCRQLYIDFKDAIIVYSLVER